MDTDAKVSEAVELTLRFIGDLSISNSIELQRKVISALAQISAANWQKSPSSAVQHWRIVDSEFAATASPNGVSLNDLRKTAHLLRSAFEALGNSSFSGSVNWPKGVPEKAQQDIIEIGMSLASDDLTEIEVSIDDEDDLHISSVFLGIKLGEATSSELSELEGRIDRMQVGGRNEFRLIDNNTRARVLCAYRPEDFEAIKVFFTPQPPLVRVTGIVSFRSDQTPYRVKDSRVAKVPPPTTPRVESYLGSLPGLTGGEDAHTYIRRMRDDES